MPCAQDIVTASPNFDIGAFVPALKECLSVINPFKRQFLISWITVLDSVPDSELLRYLPELLDGLFAMLSDPNRELKQAVHKALQVGVQVPVQGLGHNMVQGLGDLGLQGAVHH